MSLKPDPMGELRNPFQVYMLTLAIGAGVPSVIGNPPSGSVSALLSEPYVNIWGLMLLTGGILALAGMFWQGDARNGLYFKRLGFIALAIANTIVAAVIFLTQGWWGAYPGMVVLGFSLACYLRARSVNRHMMTLIRRSRHVKE